VKVLVVGGAGFIGSHLADKLIETGRDVEVFDSLEAQVHGPRRERPSYLSPRARLIEADVRDLDALRSAVGDADAIFYHAAAVGVGQSMHEVRRYVDVNTMGVANLADILANTRHRVRKVVVASSMSLYGEGKYRCETHGTVYPAARAGRDVSTGWNPACPIDGCDVVLTPAPTDEDTPLRPTSIYGITKRDHEEILLCIGSAYGIPTVAVRYFNVYGSRQALSNPYTGVAAIFCSRMINGRRPLVYEDGQQLRDFVHVRDVVQASIRALDRDGADGRTVNVGSGRPITVSDVGRQLARHLGFDGAPDVTGKFRTGDIRHCFADITRAQTLLRYEPTVNFEQGSAELVDWVRDRLAADHVDQTLADLEARGLVR
jgi:dTDP-L-rhamnose 4-epimerase